MPCLLFCQSWSYRNSSSRRGVVVAIGVIQWGCSSFVLSTRPNQLVKYPSCAGSKEGIPTHHTATASKHDQRISNVSPSPGKNVSVSALLLLWQIQYDFMRFSRPQ